MTLTALLLWSALSFVGALVVIMFNAFLMYRGNIGFINVGVHVLAAVIAWVSSITFLITLAIWIFKNVA